MRAAVAGLSLMFLAGCNQLADASGTGPKNPGRFAGIGVFEAGRLWGQMTGSPSPTDPASARIQDDEHVIVVIDSHTGEIRQCGDHSGYCVSMNPWSGAGAGTSLPVKLSKHAGELAREDEAGVEDTESARNAAAPAR